ncbi:MAG: hypothetical protein ACI8XB_000531 [Patiriisocius sp.]|jgi:hypothetical protein
MELTTFSNRYLKLTLFCLLVSFIANGQEFWTMDQFLLNSFQSPVQQYQEEKITLLAEGNYRLPVIENLQFRTETRDFDLEKQDYDLRLNTNSFRSINAQEKINNTDYSIHKIHQSILLKNELSNRYNILLSLIFKRDQLTLVRQKLEIYQDKLTVLKSMSSWNLTKIKELIKVETEILEADIQKLNLESSLLNLNNRIAGMCGKEIHIVTEDLIAARFVREHFDDVVLSDSVAGKQLNLAKLKLQKNENTQHLLKNENRKLVKFYQLGYRDSDQPFEQSQLSLGIGFNLPFKGSDKLKEAKLEFENIELHSDIEIEMDDLRQEQYEIITRLENNILEYETLQRHFNNSLANKTLVKYKEIPEISALSILYLKEYNIAQNEQLMRAEFNLYRDYIESLEIFDLLDNSPFQNFLSINHLGY